jgi:hypothetical protein
MTYCNRVILPKRYSKIVPVRDLSLNRKEFFSVPGL